MSTIQVDRIIPYSSASVTIEGNVVQANAATTGSNTFVGDQNIVGTITASIAEGFVLVGGVGSVSTLVATSSFGGGGAGFPFTGDAVITGSLLISGGLDNDLRIEGRQVITGPTTGQTPQLQISGSDATNTIGRTSIVINVTTGSLQPVVSVASGSGVNTGNQHQSLVQSTQIFNSDVASTSAIKRIAIAANPSKLGFAALSAVTEPSLLGVNNLGVSYQVLELQSQGNFTDGTISFKVPVAVTGSVSVSGNTFISSSQIFLTGSGGSFINLFQRVGGDTQSAIRFFSGSTIDEDPRHINLGAAPGALNISAQGGAFTNFADFDYQSNQIRFYQNTRIIDNKSLVVASGSATTNVGAFSITNIRANGTGSLYGSAQLTVRDNFQRAGLIGGLQGFESQNPTQYLNIVADNAAYGNSGWPGAGIAVENNNGSDYPVVIGFQTKATFTDGTVTILKPLDVSGSVNITQVLKLTGLDPLPANGVGQLAVSGSNLFYNDGSTWTQIN